MKALAIVTAVLIAASSAADAQRIAPSAYSPFFRSRAGFTTHAKVAALVIGGGNLSRAVGVKQVTHPDVGIYCVEPSIALNYNGIFPLLSVEFESSAGLELFAYYVESAPDCQGTKSVEVKTISVDGTTASPSDHVCFILTVQ